MKRINVSSGAKWETLVGYSRLVRAGDEIFVTGTVAFTADGGFVGEDDAHAQACQCFRNIESALAQVGASLRDVVRTRIFVTHIERDWEAVGRAHAEWLGEVKPATSMLEVSRLIEDRYLVEIEADARLGCDEIVGPESLDSRGAAASTNTANPVVEDAAINDAGSIAELLNADGLCVPNEEDGPVRMLVARIGSEIAGCVGCERWGDQALLRSCAVAASKRGRGLGTRLVRALLERLQRAGVKEVYLLTLDADPFFARFGFAPVDRGRVPASVRDSREFTIHHCDRAVCMRASLPLKSI